MEESDHQSSLVCHRHVCLYKWLCRLSCSSSVVQDNGGVGGIKNQNRGEKKKSQCQRSHKKREKQPVKETKKTGERECPKWTCLGNQKLKNTL